MRSTEDMDAASGAGADVVLLLNQSFVETVRAHTSEGVNHSIEVDFGANLETNWVVFLRVDPPSK